MTSQVSGVFKENPEFFDCLEDFNPKELNELDITYTGQLDFKELKNTGIFYHIPTMYKKFSHIAAFDLDGTLVYGEHALYPREPSDIQIYPLRREFLVSLIKRGYTLAVFTNQKSKSRAEKLKKVERVKNFLHNIQLPIYTFIATGDEGRKPDIAMFDLLKTFINVKYSVFCGDALGRPQDFSDSDLTFAENAKFNVILTPEECFPPTDHPEFFNKRQMVITVGMPGSGKSSYIKQEIPNFVYISQDVLKTKAKVDKLIDSSLKTGNSIVIDGTHPSQERRQEFYDKAEMYGYSVVVMYFVANGYGYNSLREENKVPTIAYHLYFSKLEPPTPDNTMGKLYIMWYPDRNSAYHYRQEEEYPREEEKIEILETLESNGTPLPHSHLSMSNSPSSPSTTESPSMDSPFTSPERSTPSFVECDLTDEGSGYTPSITDKFYPFSSVPLSYVEYFRKEFKNYCDENNMDPSVVDKHFSNFKTFCDFCNYLDYNNNDGILFEDALAGLSDFLCGMDGLSKWVERREWSVLSTGPLMLYQNLGVFDYNSYNEYAPISYECANDIEFSEKIGLMTDIPSHKRLEVWLGEMKIHIVEKDEWRLTDYQDPWKSFFKDRFLEQVKETDWSDIKQVYLTVKKLGPVDFFYETFANSPLHDELCPECSFCFREGGRCNRPPVGDKKVIYDKLGENYAQFMVRYCIDWQHKYNSLMCKWNLRLWEECDSVEGYFKLLENVKMFDTDIGRAYSGFAGYHSVVN